MRQKYRTKQDQSGTAFLKLEWAKIKHTQELLSHFFFISELDIHNLGKECAIAR